MTLKTVAGLIANALVAWARLTIIPFCSPSRFAVASLVDAGAARSLLNPVRPSTGGKLSGKAPSDEYG